MKQWIDKRSGWVPPYWSYHVKTHLLQFIVEWLDYGANDVMEDPVHLECYAG